MELSFVSQWEKYLRAQQSYAPLTIQQYAAHARELLTWVGNHYDVATPVEVTPEMVEAWMLDHESWGQQTRKLHILAVKAFFEYLVERGTIASSPCTILRPVRIKKRIDESVDDTKENRVYTPDQIIALLECVPKRAHISPLLTLRNKAIIALMAATGMRCSEVTWLTVGQIRNQRNGVIFALRKGQNVKRVYVADFAFQYIAEYLKKRGDVPDDAPLFASCAGKPMCRSDVYDMLRARQETLGLRTGTHNMRYTVLNNVERFADAVVARDVAGQSSISITNGYMVSSGSERAEAIAALPWAAMLGKKMI